MKYDKYVNKLSTHIVSISQVVTRILVEKEKVSAEKIYLIHHGFILQDFAKKNNEKTGLLHQKYNEKGNKPVVGVISRYVNWKGIQYIIPAFKEVLKTYPDAHLILANTNGNFKNEIKQLLKELPEENYTEIVFEKDIFSLYHLFDVFVHTPISVQAEAFGQTYVEALASGIPSVFTLSGVANEFIIDRKNAVVVPYANSESITNSIKLLLDDDHLRNNLTTQGKQDVMDKFALPNMINLLEVLYGK